jgi:hypothetical protein
VAAAVAAAAAAARPYMFSVYSYMKNTENTVKYCMVIMS